MPVRVHDQRVGKSMKSGKADSGITNIQSHSKARNAPGKSSGPTFRRTKKGSEELVLRKQGLPEEQRKILLYASGSRTLEDFERLIPEVAESPDILFVMEELGFLEIFDPAITNDAPSTPEPSSEPTQVQQTVSPSSTASTLDMVKAKLTRDVAAVLGSESGTALKRIESVRSEQELRDVMAKLVELIKLYAGGRESELFIREYDDFLRG